MGVEQRVLSYEDESPVLRLKTHDFLERFRIIFPQDFDNALGGVLLSLFF